MDITNLIRLGLALIFVLSLMAILALIMKKINGGSGAFKGQDKRLDIIEQRMLDPKHKLMLIKRDQTEHLVILSNNDTIVVESGITPPAETTHKPSQVEPRNRKDIPVESI